MNIFGKIFKRYGISMTGTDSIKKNFSPEFILKNRLNFIERARAPTMLRLDKT